MIVSRNYNFRPVSTRHPKSGACNCPTSQEAIVLFTSIDIIFFGISLLICIIIAPYLWFRCSIPPWQPECEYSITEKKQISIFVVLAAVMSFCVLGIAQALVLWCSAEKKKLVGCVIWIIFGLIIFILQFKWTISNHGAPIKFLFYCIALLYRFYELLVVCAFIMELRELSHVQDTSVI